MPETRQWDCLGFGTVFFFFFFFENYESCTRRSLSDETPLLFLYYKVVLFLIKDLRFIKVGAVHLRLPYMWLSRYIIYGKHIFMI